MLTVSVVIPARSINSGLIKEVIPAILNQSYQPESIILVVDKKERNLNLSEKVIVLVSPKTNPAYKRDLGVTHSQSDIIAFLDDDAYPETTWLETALVYFNDSRIAAVGGPGITPVSDTLFQKVSGWIWSSWLGAGGAGTYRTVPSSKRFVDDYPTFNLLVRRKDFIDVGGFNTQFWPGEDTVLCHNLTQILQKKIMYVPEAFVYHHRRAVFLLHLQQISRYGLHRGYFVRVLPKTSKRIGYFIPMAFTFSLLLFPLLKFLLLVINFTFFSLLTAMLFNIIILTYIFSVVLTSLWICTRSKDLRIAFLAIPTLFLTHITYGVFFTKGLLSSSLKH